MSSCAPKKSWLRRRVARPVSEPLRRPAAISSWNGDDNDQAIADFTEAIHLDPRYSTAYANRSDAWRLKGDLDRSVADADQTIALDPTDPLNYTRCTDTRRYRGDYTQSPAGRSLCLWFPTGRRAVLFCCGQMTN